MLALANAADAGIVNAIFVHDRIEDIPLPDGPVDVVISNCVASPPPRHAGERSERESSGLGGTKLAKIKTRHRADQEDSKRTDA